MSTAPSLRQLFLRLHAIPALIVPYRKLNALCRAFNASFHHKWLAIMTVVLLTILFVARTDTTITSLEWAISELLRHAEAMQELRQEALKIGQGRSSIFEDELDKMPYLKVAIKETLRFHCFLANQRKISNY
ncbi:hypothetical protein R6Q59_025532 [Mikania micrantha]